MTRTAPASVARVISRLHPIPHRCPPVPPRAADPPFSRKFKIVHFLHRRRELGVRKYSDKWDGRHEFAQQTESLQLHLAGPKGKACDVAARAIIAGDEAGLDGVATHPKDNRDRCGRSLGGEGRNITTDTNQDGHIAAHQIGGQSRQPVVIAFRPTILNLDILTVSKTRFRQSFLECNDEVGGIQRARDRS